MAYRIALHELLKNERTDALLAGPYIVFPSNHQSSFKTFLSRYGFIPVDYNHYDIVNKEEIIINTALNIEIEDTFRLTFTEKTKTSHVVQLIKQLLERGENTIVYCNQKYLTEKWAKVLLDKKIGLNVADDERIIRLTGHIENLFADRIGTQWIVLKALKKGIGIHHGLVPKYIQQEIISLFNDGILKILLCTTTITEGVNTTAKNIVVLSGKKGKKDLKKFDAQNIEGRAGRFMQHYQGRVFILDKEFSKHMNEEPELLRHIFFDKNADKQDVDIVLTEQAYLTDEQITRRNHLDRLKDSGIMPQACFEEFRTISYEDKISLYKTIAHFSDADRVKINKLIQHFVGLHKSFRSGLELICQSIRPIVKNTKLRFYIENGDEQRGACYLVDMISAFIAKGFAGSANYYIKKAGDVDSGIRKAADFVFNLLRYQVVKYFGLFNLLYKHHEAVSHNKNIDEVNGLEALLMRLEYCADTMLGRRASDIGASFKVVKYYDIKEQNPNDHKIVEDFYSQLDDFERYNVSKINQIL